MSLTSRKPALTRSRTLVVTEDVKHAGLPGLDFNVTYQR